MKYLSDIIQRGVGFIGLILHEPFIVPWLVHMHLLQSSKSSILDQACRSLSMNVLSSFHDWFTFARDDVVGLSRRLFNSSISISVIVLGARSGTVAAAAVAA